MLMVIIFAAIAIVIVLAAVRIILGIFLPRPAMASFDRGIATAGNVAGKFSVLCFAALIIAAVWLAFRPV